MGTRSLTVFTEGDREIAVLYRQFDGYLDGHGQELADFLQGKKVVNGISGDASKVFNCMGGLAAQCVAHFTDPDAAGNFYLFPAGTRGVGEEFTYIVSADAPHAFNNADAKEATITVEGLFSGPASTFDASEINERDDD